MTEEYAFALVDFDYWVLTLSFVNVVQIWKSYFSPLIHLVKASNPLNLALGLVSLLHSHN